MPPIERSELLTRVLCDVPPVSAPDAVYLFTQTRDNQDSVLAAGCRLVRRYDAARLCIHGSEARNGYPGFEAWQAALVEQGAPADRIEGVAALADPLNTLTESTALIHHAKEQAYRTLLVTAPPFHQLRALMTAVTVAVDAYPHLQIYSQPGAVLAWNQSVRHSQGTLAATRQELIRVELERISTYQRKGDLGSFRLVLDYLDARDEAALQRTAGIL